MISPCIDCSTRHHACHDSCEDYKAWKAERDYKSEARRDAILDYAEAIIDAEGNE